MLLRCSAVCLLLTALTAAQTSAPPQLDAGVKKLPFTFAAYGDMRLTDPSISNADDDSAAKLAPSDAKRRDAIIGRIAETKPAFVVISGDLVYRGGDSADWVRWDEEGKPFHDAGVAVYPTLGNHELVRFPSDQDAAIPLQNYFQRFPQLAQHRQYSLRAQNCMFFFLDTNLDIPADNAPGAAQWDWLMEQLGQLPKDIRFVFLVQHHPFMTEVATESGSIYRQGHPLGDGNSARAAQVEARRAQLEAKRQQIGRPIIVLAGHNHNYEHFEHDGVTYITSGGGGATPYTVKRDGADLFKQPGVNYHYCSLQVSKDKVAFQMHKLVFVDGQAKWTVADSFEVAAPAAAKKPPQKAKAKPARAAGTGKH